MRTDPGPTPFLQHLAQSPTRYETVLSVLPWPQGGGQARYGYTPGAARYLDGEIARSLDAAGFKAVAAS